jgi:tetratricopeptide (TPR) repeat protein
LLLAVLIGLGAAACGPRPGSDAARREYLAALEGQKRSMSLEEQRAHVERALELDRGDAPYWQARAGYEIAQHELAAAESDLDRAIELRDRPYLRYQRGAVRCERGELAGALADFDLAIAAQPDNAQFYLERSVARAAAGRADDALDDALRMIALSPQRAESFYARGVARIALGRAEDAVEDFTLVIEQRPELAYPLLARADAYARLGRVELAREDRAAAARDGHWGDGPCKAWPPRAAVVPGAQ